MQLTEIKSVRLVMEASTHNRLQEYIPIIDIFSEAECIIIILFWPDYYVAAYSSSQQPSHTLLTYKTR